MKAIFNFDQAMREVRRISAAGRRTECRAYHLWDGFDDYDGSHEVWSSVTGSASYSTAYARFPAAPNCAGKGIRFVGGSGSNKNWNMASSQSRMLFSFAVYFENFGTANYAQFIHFMNNGNIECALAVSAAGALALMNATSTTTVLAGSGPGVVSVGTYYFIDIDITISASVGAVTVHLSTPAGGSSLFSATGLNTLGFSSIASINQFSIGDLSSGIGLRFDDFHAMDPTGAAPNAILGEGSRIYTKLPIGAGFATTLTPNGASANWQCVDDNPPDDDTTYNSAATFPLTEGYGIGAAGFTGVVNGLVRRSRIRKDDAGAHTFQNGIRSGSTNALATAVAVPSSYGYTDSFSATDPNTSAAWAAAGADAAQPILSAAS